VPGFLVFLIEFLAHPLGESLWAVKSLVIHVIYDFDIIWVFSTAVFRVMQRDILLIVFFTTVGLSSRFATLIQGGKTLLVLLLLAVLYLFIQNLTGIGIAKMTGLDLSVGVLGGSVSLSGGHGTAIAWTPIFENQYQIKNAAEIGIACATFGLILGGVIGGPIAKYLIKQYDLKPESKENLSIGLMNEETQKISVDSMLQVLLVLSIAVGIGLHLHQLLQSFGLKLPIFVPCLFGGIILTNTIPYLFKKITWPTGTPTLALVSDLSLGLFLSMSLMSLQLWSLINLAVPIFILLLAQVLVISIFAIFVVFKALGKDYEAAIMSAGYAGLALGATPTAIANMTAVSKKYGAAPKAFIVVPLVGAFFVDISNSMIIQALLEWLN
jgi:ESS family glutamate:Na+ symporter